MGDQFVICDREKDFIFIINSDNQGHSPATRAILYYVLYDVIINNLGEPLKEDAEAYEKKGKVCLEIFLSVELTLKL